MGHHIDPTDPVNGGCPICVHYVPHALTASYDRFGFEIYDGSLLSQPGDPLHWMGVLVSPTLLFIRVFIYFCALPLGALHVVVQGLQQFDILDAHCTFPISGTAPNADTLIITLPEA